MSEGHSQRTMYVWDQTWLLAGLIGPLFCECLPPWRHGALAFLTCKDFLPFVICCLLSERKIFKNLPAHKKI